MKKIFVYLIVVILSEFVLISCSPTHTLTENEFLVNKNSILIDNKKVNTDEIYNYIKQKPNRKILFLFRFHLGVYNLTHSKKEHKFLKWIGVYKMSDIIGEPPVILDTLLTNKSVKQIKLYLYSKGYFNSTVSKQINYKKKKAEIKYIVNTSQPYCIKNIEYKIKDELIHSLVMSDTANSLIVRGNNFDTDVLQNERERITANLKNNGYYFFTKEFITYNVDSAVGNHQLNISMELRNPVKKFDNNPDSIIETTHKRYTINEINIYTNYNSLDQDTTKYKKYTYYAAQRNKNAALVKYNFYYKDTFRLNPKIVTQSIFFKPGDYFLLDDEAQTYVRFTDLKMFKFINIKFDETPHDSTVDNNTLDCKIQLTKTPVQSFSIETEATKSAENLGVAGDFLYQNKNIFRGAEIFNFKISGAVEIQKILGNKSSETGIKQILPNTFETGAEASIDIPKFLIPIKQERFPKYFKPKTIINTGINYQKRPDYTRYIINVSYGYEWKESSTKKHLLFPADVNSVKIFPTDTFVNAINLINDPKIRNSYVDHLTMALKYSFIFNNQQQNKKNKFSYFRANFETSGNILRALNNIFNDYHYADGHYNMFNIRYAEYVRGDIDYRHYFIFDKFNTLVVRGIVGYGLAYGNSSVMPFEKSFFVGGANSIRAWSIYSLGPGSYNNPEKNNFNRTGDIDIEANAEYRFPIYGFFKGAFFADAGNIWLNKKNTLMPDAEFEINKFYKQIAVGSGFGLRFDFSFFIMRLDAAIPLRDPSNPENERWQIKTLTKKDIQFNLGIGYPF